MKEKLTVVGAAIISDGRVLALRRKFGNESVIHKFEFVGGKVLDGEDPKQALMRECLEELNMKIEVGDKLATIDYDYPDMTITLTVYFAKALSDFELIEHEESVWMDTRDLKDDEWAPADTEFLDILKKGQIAFCNAKGEEDFEKICELQRSEFEEIDATQNACCESLEEMKSNLERGYVYTVVYLNSEPVGFFTVAPSVLFEGYESGFVLTNIFFKKFARGRGLADKVFSALPRPIYLSLSKSSNHTLSVCKHCGFKIIKSILDGEIGKYVLELD